MKSTLLIVLALAACGDNNLAPDARVTGDARRGDGGAAAPRAVMVAPNLSGGVGILSVLELETMHVRQNVAAGVVGSDPVLRKFGDELYVVNRAENNVVILDADTFNYLAQIGTGAASNPQDVAVVGDKLYIPALGTSGVVVAQRGSSAVTTIDLHTALGDADGKPDCISAFAVGTSVFVACDLLTNFAATVNGKVAVIDATTDTVTTSFDMPVKNPYGALFVQSPATSVFGGDLLISSEPSFADLTAGCVVRVSTGASPAASCAIQNSAVGGAQGHIEVLPGNAPTLWLAMTSNFSDGRIRAFDLQTSDFWPTVSPTTQVIRDLAACPDGRMAALDAMGTGGFRVYGATGTEVTTDALAAGLPVGFGNDLVCY